MSSGTATSTVGTSSTSCELWDLVLAEFQQLLGRGEVIAEAEDGSAELREFVLLVGRVVEASACGDRG